MSSRFLFFFNDTATTEIYTLSLHDALPIYGTRRRRSTSRRRPTSCRRLTSDRRPTVPRSRAQAFRSPGRGRPGRSEEHTSELQSRRDLVCRLLLEKKKKNLNTSNELLQLQL